MKTKQQTRPDRTTKLKQELKKPTTAPNKSRPEPKESAQLLPTKKSNLKINAITVAIVLGILPAAAVGTATSFFSQQLLQADNSRATQTQIESLQTKQQEVLLMGALATTTVAAIAGIFAALWANRTIERATKEARAAAAEKYREERADRSHLLTDSINSIRASFTREDLLQATVEETRRALRADRVVVYSLDKYSQGTVIAESVDANFSISLGVKFDDPCFTAQYLEKYQNGRVQAIDNIYEADLSSCYINQLKEFQVKANLIAPLMNQGKLIGLLIAHQCSTARRWQQSEIDLFVQLAAQAGFALDNAELLEEYDNLAKQVDAEIKWKDYLTDATKHLYEHLDFEEVLKAGVEEGRRVLGCDRVVIYSVDRQSQGIIIAESVGPGWVRTLGRKIEDPCFEAKYIAQYENGRVRAWNNIHEAGMTSCYVEQLEKIAVKANLVAPVVHEGKLLGIIAAHQCSGPREWQDLEITWLKQLGIQVGFALDNAKLMTQVERMSREAETTALKQRQQIEALQRQVEKILSDSQKAISNFSDDTQRQTDYVTAVLEQIQALADSARSTIAQAQQIEKQLKQTSQAVEAGHENIDLTVDRLNMILEDFTEAKDKMKHLGDSSQGISQVINLIEDLASQMNQEAINVTIEAGRKEDHEGEYVASLAETLRFCSQQLATATSQMQPEISQIETQTSQLASAMETKIDDILKEAELVKETRQKLNQVATINFQINALVEKISLSAIDQVETSVTARKSIMEAANLATKSSEQFAIVNESCKKLAEVTQEL